MEEKKCGIDCSSVCGNRECHYLRELEDGRIVAVACKGNCSGKCVGKLHGDSPASSNTGQTPVDRFRATVRSRELYLEPSVDHDGQHDGSCAVGCFVGHGDGAAGNPACYGACLGLCSGVAVLQEVTSADLTRRRGPAQ